MSKLTRLNLCRHDIVALGDSLGVVANKFKPQLVIANIYQRIPFSRDKILFSEESAARCRLGTQLWINEGDLKGRTSARCLHVLFRKRERMRLASFSSLILARGSAMKERASCLSSFACLPSLINLQGRRKLRVRWRCWRETGRGCWINIYRDEDEIRDIQATAKVPSRTKQKHGVRLCLIYFDCQGLEH